MMAIAKTKKIEIKTKKESKLGVVVDLKPELGDGFAIIETGGKQYKVSSGDVVLVEKISDAHNEGDVVVFDKVLLTSDGADLVLGNPYISGKTVRAVFQEHKRGKKIEIVRFKSKSRYAKRSGHRQTYAKIKFL